ncbi:MAG: biotin/lipoyl-binding protein [Coprothermobacterota bacterium]|nr:biotin/lipoyl-binding protein [Coprothermobacterota bacterium]
MARKYLIKVNNKTYEVEVEEVVRRSTNPLVMPQAAEAPPTVLPPRAPVSSPKTVAVQMPSVPPTPSGKPRVVEMVGLKKVQAPMTGKIIAILCQSGQEVQEGDVILTLEAMKMETEMAAPFPGRIQQILVVEGQNVTAGETLVVMK